MALTDDNNGMIMPVQPMYGNGFGGGMGGFGFGGDWAWILLLLVLGGGWGGFGGFGMGGMMGAGMLGMDMGFGLYPWLNNSQNINDGFRDAQLHDSVTSVRDGISSLSTQLCNCCGDMQLGLANGVNSINQNLCNGFNGVNNSIFGAQTAISQQLNSNELASLNRSFAEQTANMQGFNGVQAQIAQSSCDNRLGTETLKATVLQENCQGRYEAQSNTRDIIAAVTAGVQSIKDQLCQDKIDEKNDIIAQLRQENLYARGQASQVAQTAELLANNNAQTALFQQGMNNEVDALYTRLQNCPVNTVPVYGNQRIFSCNNNCGCNTGCGCGNNF
jgi:hypothetical protein